MNDNTQTHVDLWLDACQTANNYARLAKSDKLTEAGRALHTQRFREWAAIAAALRPRNER